MRVFVAIPSGKSARIGPTNSNPRIIGDFEQFLVNYSRSEMGQISECLLRIQKHQILERVGILSKWQRFAIKSVLEHQNQSLQSLSQGYDPLPSRRHSATGVLSTDEQEDGADVRVEVVFNGPVSLIPNATAFVVVVIEYLLEYILLLIEHKFLFRILHRLIHESDLLLKGKGDGGQKKQGNNELHLSINNRFIINDISISRYIINMIQKSRFILLYNFSNRVQQKHLHQQNMQVQSRTVLLYQSATLFRTVHQLESLAQKQIQQNVLLICPQKVSTQILSLTIQTILQHTLRLNKLIVSQQICYHYQQSFYHVFLRGSFGIFEKSATNFVVGWVTVKALFGEQRGKDESNSLAQVSMHPTLEILLIYISIFDGFNQLTLYRNLVFSIMLSYPGVVEANLLQFLI